MDQKYILNPQNSLAILIGIEHYEDFARVDPASNNVYEFAKVLADEEIFGFPRERIIKIIGGKSAEIKETLFDIFEKLHGQQLETLLLYFVGHGYRRPNGDYYLAAEDSKKRLLRFDGSSGISFNAIKTILMESGIPQRLIFLDSCYSGTATLSDQNGVEEMRMKGTFTISSSDSREVSYFDTAHHYTLFTGELLGILRGGLSDAGERIGLDDLYGALQKAVRSRNPKMSPQQMGSEEITGGNYLFCKNRQYNAMAAQRAEITAAMGLGDDHLHQQMLQQAEYQYLRAKQMAEEQGLLPDFMAEIHSRMEKLRYAKALQLDWKKQDPKPTGQPGPAHWLARLQRRKTWAILGILLVAVMLGTIVYQALGGGQQSQGTTQVAHRTGQAGSDASTSTPQGDPDRKLTAAEVIANIAQNMLPIAGGTYTRGCTFEQADDCEDNEQHLAVVTVQDFLLNRYEVTQAEWRAVMGADPSELEFKGCDRCPVERVSWHEAQTFIKVLNEKTGKRYRLPTESEWEYAARGGQNSKEFKYAGSGDLETVAWYLDNSNAQTHPVGTRAPNELGLYDMSGNVYEWCQDNFHESYAGAPNDGSAWETLTGDPTKRVLRGGSWDHPAGRCRVSNRSMWRADKRYKDVGLRLVHGH